MTVGSLRLAAALACMAGLVVPPGPAQQPDPAARIRAFYDALLETMKQAEQLGLRGRYDKLMPVLTRTYDFPGMMRLAAGPGWTAATKEQQVALVQAFAHMTTAIYAGRFKGYNGEKLEVLSTADQPPSDKLVRTRIVPAGGKAAELTYLMRNTGEGWKIGDVYLDGSISELAMRRVEFGGFVRSGGPDALIAALRKKGDQLLDSK